MRSILIILLTCFFGTQLAAQSCDGFWYMTNNAEVIMTTYDKKGEPSGKVTYKISNLSRNGATSTADFNSEMVDEKGKSVSKGAGKYQCTGGVMFIDAKASLPQENMAAYKDMDVKADQAYIEYPASLAAGQAIKDVDFSMSIWNKGSKFSDISLKQTNRKAESKESVTTAAGTWECYKITFDGQFRAAIGPIGIPLNFRGIEWFAPGFGVVKTETYSKNGKLAGSTAITSVKK